MSTSILFGMGFRPYCLILAYLILGTVNGQDIKYLFFDFTQDSLRHRSAQVMIPTQGQAGSINNSLVVDYIGNTRVSMSTAILASKKDTLLVMHSLFNGLGNFSFEFETPIVMFLIKKQQRNGIGFSFNPRSNAMIHTGQVFEKSSMSYDIGFNGMLQLSGDLGNMGIKLLFRNAFALGNYQFLEKVYGIQNRGFYYNSLQIKIKANNNVFIVNIPIVIVPMKGKEISDLPIFAGFGVRF